MIFKVKLVIPIKIKKTVKYKHVKTIYYSIIIKYTISANIDVTTHSEIILKSYFRLT